MFDYIDRRAAGKKVVMVSTYHTVITENSGI